MSGALALKAATAAGILVALVGGLWLWEAHGLAIWTGAAFTFCL
ncbi:hypothetical protein [Aureimonas altamirensis]|nr:hypothetical protein [Aureimonas altamirensis]